MKSLICISLVLSVALFYSSCSSDFLEVEENGKLTDDILATEEGIDGLLIGAYSLLDGVSASLSGDPWFTTASNWLFADVRGLIANKGSDAGDSFSGSPIITFSEKSTNAPLHNKWKMLYEAIARCNSAIRVINLAESRGTISKEKAENFRLQAIGLRGWYHFEAWRFWEKIPYIDESADPFTATNKEDARDKIIADLEAATQLPDNMGQVGRFNGTVCKVILAKAFMQMYHNYQAALPLLEYVVNSGSKPNGEPVGLANTYGEIFDIENRNGKEAVYTVQYSVNDGSGGYNGSYGEVLNFPFKGNHMSPAGCCGFFQPTQEYVNSFRTLNGLPLQNNEYDLPENAVRNDFGVPASKIWDASTEYPKDAVVAILPDYHTHNFYKSLIEENKGNNPVSSPAAWQATTTWTEDQAPVDPRLDWSVGRKGIPYWDWGIVTGSDWIRDPNTSGVYSPKKQVYKKSQEAKYTEQGNWTNGFTANGYRMIRFADVLLLYAECQMETGNLEGALQSINAVRERAAHTDGFVKEADGITPAANYQISPYPAFPDLEYARKALYIERKLELGMEGHRWFDLNRWGITANELNRILDYEKTLPYGTRLYGNAQVGPEDATYPIPDYEIDLSGGNLIQNRIEE